MAIQFSFQMKFSDTIEALLHGTKFMCAPGNDPEYKDLEAITEEKFMCVVQFQCIENFF